ncbi:MAG: phenylalanine--tRNA ligase subunit beta [Firmicutes bacterium]|nr:phenylalanine--tRNA ligase subunit beta [Bacillota bacterium]
MKLSRKFVSDYVDLDENLTIEEIAEAMTSVGNEYDSASKLINCTNLTVGEVIECEDHPNSDHLHVCKVNVGSEILDIVCGAPNVRKGLKVIVALAGAKLPGGEIKKGEIRGCVSNGMLCSIAELGLDNKFLDEKDKSGIHELPNDTEVGIDPIKVLGLDDEVIDFELTSNRGDLLSIIGMAYELGAIYKKEVKDIDLSYNSNNDDINNSFKVVVNTEDCSMFLAKKALNVTIKESPDFIKNRLIASGIRPINNVVDISNYVMLETGQPLHFYDAEALGDTIVVRNAFEGETLTTLDNQERILSTDDIVIADKTKAVGLAGVMGGLSTEVENETKNILIESAIFDSVKIRRTSKKILRSEASNRFEKGLDPKRTYMAIERSCHLLEKYADATIVGGIVEYNKTNSDDKTIELEYNKISKVLGLTIDKNEVVDILKSLGFNVELNNDIYTVTVPSRRLDINIKEDLIEEIGRIYGVDNIKGKLPTFDGKLGKFNKTNREIKNKMTSLGLNETCSYTLIPESEVNKFTKDEFVSIKLSDPMSEDRSTLRYSLLYSLKEVYEYNKSRNYKDISIFEMGKGFYKEDDTYKEDLKLACLMSGNYYLGLNKVNVDFYIIKGIVEELLNYLGYTNRYSFVIDENIPGELHPGISASIIMQGELIGCIGKMHPNVTKDDIYVFEINLTKLLKNKSSRMSFKELSKYPSVTKDLAFIMKKDILSENIEKVIKKAGGRLLTNIEVFDLYMGDNIGVDEKSIAYKLTFSDFNKTLSDEEVMEVFNKIISEVESKTEAKLRG